MGVVRVTGHIFKFLEPHHIFGTDEIRQFKVVTQTDTDEHQGMNDGLPPKAMCSGSHDLFSFWEIADYIS